MEGKFLLERAVHLSNILAADTLRTLLHPALKHFLEVVSLYYPLPIKVGRYSDEISLLIDLLAHGYNLYYHSVGWAERNCGLVRRYDGELSRRAFLTRSLLQLAALPYILRKLKTLLNRHLGKEIIRTLGNKLQPYLHYFSSLLTLRSIVRFLIGRSMYTSLQQEVIGVRLHRRTQTDVELSKQLLRKEGLCIKVVDLLFRSVFRAITAGAFLTQLWASSAEDIRALLNPPLELPKLPRVVFSTPAGHCPLCRNKFKKPMAVQPSGIVYCQECIVKFVENNSRCPVTSMAVSRNQLILLFD